VSVPLTAAGKPAYRAIETCRVCGSSSLETILELGDQALTGVFPTHKGQKVTRGPLDLVKCTGPCGLVQLRHSYEPTEMYGENYGYRSGLNRSMVEHLQAKVEGLKKLVTIDPSDVILDVGSNDGTTLSFYPEGSATLLGIDPTSAKFARYYRKDIQRVADFFTADNFRKLAGNKKAKIVTSIAMFYDLEAPLDFMQHVHDVLADDGVWHFEQSYLPLMLSQLAYDTVCHEHIEYYGLQQIKWMADKIGFALVDVQLNGSNGGSFAVTVKKKRGGASGEKAADELPKSAADLLAKETAEGMDTLRPYEEFAAAVAHHKTALNETLADLRGKGKTVFGMGASTKGNVVLQYCGLTEKELPCVAEVNEEKFGRFCPGTEIPIVSEADAAAQKPDAYLVLPWHFRDNLIRRHQDYLANGGKLLFPLPKIELYGP
jgi:SAM-dependent methyltransferase